MASPLHMTRVAFGCAAWEEIDARQRRMLQARPDGVRFITTARGPARAADLAGGSLFWIIKHRIVARQRLVGFEPHDRGTAILLEPEVIQVLPVVRRSHQGWRYLQHTDVPLDLAEAGDAAALPPDLAATLGSLGLV